MYLHNFARLGICLPLIFNAGNAISAPNKITTKLTISGRVITTPCQASLEFDKLVATCNNHGQISRDTIELTKLELIDKTELTFAQVSYQWVDKANTMAIIKMNHY